MKRDLLILIICCVLSFTAAHFLAPRAPQNQTSETAFSRVMRTGVLRCGYYVFFPATRRDPTTGALSGLSVDMMEAIAKNAGLKVEWTEETDFGNWHPGLAAKRFDAMCTPMWPDASLARVALFTRPMFYAGIKAYARVDDHRFDNNLKAINDPSVTIVAYENDATWVIASQNFPKAKLIVMPANTPGGLAAENVIMKKADIVLWDANGAFEFQKSKPGSIRDVAPEQPLKVMPFELLTSIDDPQLRDFLDVGIQELEDTGEMDRLVNKWEQTPGNFYRMARPYVIGVEKR